jgi:membrane protein DedA with SNARE-associated domain
MDLSAFLEQTLAFIQQHRAWAGVIYGLMAFGESMVVIGVLIPATTVMLAAGALVGAGTLPFLDLWIGGAVGAALGDSLSFWIGRRLGPAAHRLWPFSRHPEMLEAASRLFAHWGWLAVVIGRFIGPLRASVPTFAGVAGMGSATFQLANVGSAIAWIPVLIFPGSAGAWAWRLFVEGDPWTGAAVGLGLVAALLATWVAWKRLLPALMRNGPKDR